MLMNRLAVTVAATGLCAGVGAQCVSDVNGDFYQTGTDFGAWLNAFNAGDLAADMNGDGLVDNTDYGAWLADFNGCPNRLDNYIRNSQLEAYSLIFSTLPTESDLYDIASEYIEIPHGVPGWQGNFFAYLSDGTRYRVDSAMMFEESIQADDLPGELSMNDIASMGTRSQLHFSVITNETTGDSVEVFAAVIHFEDTDFDEPRFIILDVLAGTEWEGVTADFDYLWAITEGYGYFATEQGAFCICPNGMAAIRTPAYDACLGNASATYYATTKQLNRQYTRRRNATGTVSIVGGIVTAVCIPCAPVSLPIALTGGGAMISNRLNYIDDMEQAWLDRDLAYLACCQALAANGGCP